MDGRLPSPSQRTVYREIARKTPFELTLARYGKRHADMEFRVSMTGPTASRALQRVVMDHTPDISLWMMTVCCRWEADNYHGSMNTPDVQWASIRFRAAELPGSDAMSEACDSAKPMCHATFPRSRSVGVPRPSGAVVVDNPPEFHSTHFEHACLQIGTDIQYAKVLVPWYKGTLERFQGT